KYDLETSGVGEFTLLGRAQRVIATLARDKYVKPPPLQVDVADRVCKIKVHLAALLRCLSCDVGRGDEQARFGSMRPKCAKLVQHFEAVDVLYFHCVPLACVGAVNLDQGIRTDERASVQFWFPR